ncbi:YcgL domain-containing protein [Marinobacter nanhaiticus D15-8W]|uniref:YcgL domain-containing protein J057_22800 n=1 Tax=Marinobacter nanhaiticus D15-8W TaxID=626887 RepID=N6WTC7_9GAMM|nr:YcgL domain-containing protein [Marinobacter nanhaiticus]ENO14272.1 YcgL domain-containing protein [Marinobacter nanhaiticus D15-8W]BES71660.1 YcgL domain-containing protein [Marinobacter nanhaiticus D15-8W]
MAERQFVSVFRSGTKADTYIFVRRGQKWDDLPEALRAIFGAPQHAMDLLLTEDRKLARTSGKDVLEAIEEKDFYLQLPEEQDEYIVEFKQKLKSHPE